MVSMNDVAFDAGVSKATVSRVLSKSGPISLETRDKVLASCKKLNYKMNANVQELVLKSKKGATRNIAFVMVDKDFSDPAYSSWVDFIAHEVNSAHYQLLLVKMTGKENSLFDLPPILRDTRIDGILISGAITTNAVDLISSMNIPCEVLGLYSELLLKKLPSVSNSLHSVIYDVIEQMYNAGCKKIAFVSEHKNSYHDDSSLSVFNEVISTFDDLSNESIVFRGNGAFSGTPVELRNAIFNDKIDFDGIYCPDVRVAMDICYYLTAKFGIEAEKYIKIGCSYPKSFTIPIKIYSSSRKYHKRMIEVAFAELKKEIETKEKAKCISIK